MYRTYKIRKKKVEMRFIAGTTPLTKAVGTLKFSYYYEDDHVLFDGDVVMVRGNLLNAAVKAAQEAGYRGLYKVSYQGQVFHSINYYEENFRDDHIYGVNLNFYDGAMIIVA